MNPLVSVIIPNYNHARYLTERIESVLNQTYNKYEIIILDDCSTDNSKEIIERYRVNPFVSHIVYNDVNSGRIFSQWEKGINIAKGELIWIAESDDKCTSLFLEKLVKLFENNEKLVLAFCKSIVFNDDGIENRINNIPLSADSTFEGEMFISNYMTHGCPMLNASACLFKKKTAMQINKYYTEFKGAGDRMFWTEICECGDVVVVNEWFNMMRVHDTNSTKSFNQDGTNQREDKKVLDYIYNKGYISQKKYDHLRHDYVKVHIFEMLTDKQLQQELYAYWGYSRRNQFSLRLESWLAKMFKMIHK